MASRNYKRLNPIAFGHTTISSGDIDPVYIALTSMGLSQEQLGRWLMAYWCYYHCGFASYASEFEGDAFWAVLFEAAQNTTPAPDGGRWPRGSERRHFRGQQALNALTDLKAAYGNAPERMALVCAALDQYTPEENRPFEAVSRAAKGHRGFGPWIAFKVADMVDRVLGIPVNFNDAAVFMFDDPVKGARLVAKWIALGEPDEVDADELLADLKFPASKAEIEACIEAAVSRLYDYLGHLDAPPCYSRKINLQEIETVLCKWKSHLRGHYPLNNDIDEIVHGLADCWGQTAIKFREHMPARSI